MNTRTPFDAATQSFAGSPLQQARGLLRQIDRQGEVHDQPATLPLVLERLLLTPENVDITIAQLRAFLQLRHIPESTAGGPLGDPVARANDNSASGRKAMYFVIHDTSSELAAGQAFDPAFINTNAWSGNDLSHVKLNNTHIYINRLGEARTDAKYSEALRATQFELSPKKTLPSVDSKSVIFKGLCLHHELIQPRKGPHPSAPDAPVPGFTQPQYERLALQYLIASVRRGSWMIPAFHCVIDLKVGDHDDPQHFDLAAWGAALEAMRAAVMAADGGLPPLMAAPPVPMVDVPVLKSALFKNNPALEAVADGHQILQATGGRVDGIGPVQDALVQLGFPVPQGAGNQFHGFFGEKTRSALSHFQEATTGLTTNGIVDRDTVLALDAALLAQEAVPAALPAAPVELAAAMPAALVNVLPPPVATLEEIPGGNNHVPRRPVHIRQLPGKNGFFYRAAMAIDVDGSPRAYATPQATLPPLDQEGSADAEGTKTMYIQQREKTVHGVKHIGEGPFKDFFVSRTSLLFRGDEAYKTSNFVDSEQIPFIVFPGDDQQPAACSAITLGDMAYVIDLTTGKSTHAIFADTNPRPGEASVRVAKNLGRNDLNAGNGEEEDRFLYIIFPGTFFAAETTVPHWPDSRIKSIADEAFAAWGGMAQVKALFPGVPIA